MPTQKSVEISESIKLEDIRRYYFEHTKHTLRIEDAKYLLERALELKLNHSNGGVKGLFETLKYHFEEVANK